MKTTASRWNRYTFGLGTVGRDMLYSLVSMYLIFYLTDILRLPDSMLWWLTAILLIARIFDAVNDPIMGVIVDNTDSRFGKFKPWIAAGALFTGVFTVMMYTDFGLDGAPYLIMFTVIYLLWDVSFTANDIGYWSMLPSLSMDQKEREKIGAFARICADVGLFAVVVGIVPVTNALGSALGSMKKAYFVFTVIISLLMIGGQCITLFGVKEFKGVFKKEEQTTLGGMVRAIFKNDQLLFTVIAMALFMIGYSTTTSFGLYYFKYAYGDENMYPVFALVLGVSQIIALAVFPLFRKKFERKALYAGATALVVAGYMIFFFSPMDMRFIGAAGVLVFLGEAFIQILMLMFLSDTIEYGQWKLGRRNDSVTLSLQPFINKIGNAIASGIVGATVIISGISQAASAADVTEEGLVILKAAMFILPLICILAGYVVYRLKYKIDSKMYSQILADLQARGDINLE
ncbi:MAG TPA: glycoside-pentoside-hexuronide (GPH):cation symporter [Clostridiales bacterium]|nr:glycoside-pentoside-hexuronide (GPH):cation symporter [Clostridiales bacterium]HOL91247.1 glycoside-pentoside-hexuronide (GPH):cation symporter [Clostridiales bacterium]